MASTLNSASNEEEETIPTQTLDQPSDNESQVSNPKALAPAIIDDTNTETNIEITNNETPVENEMESKQPDVTAGQTYVTTSNSVPHQKTSLKPSMSKDLEFGSLQSIGRAKAQSSADELRPNGTSEADERFLEFAEIHLAKALNEIHCPCCGKEVPLSWCCNEYSFWCCSLCLRANYTEWILIFCLFIAKILLWSIFSGHTHDQCIPMVGEDCNNMNMASINYPFKDDTITSVENYFYIGVMWSGVMIVSTIATLFLDRKWRRKIVKARDKNSVKCCNTCFCGREYSRMALVLEVLFREVLFVGFYTDVCTNTMKLAVGRPRPYYYDVMNDDDDDALKSFPSGHTSMAFALYSLLTLHILEAMIIARNRKYDICCMWELEHDKPYFLFGISIWRYFGLPGFLILIAMCPMFMATWVGITRITDYHHHYADVICGAFLGLFWSVVGFVMYRDEFRESSLKHDHLFESFTKEIKEYFLSYIQKSSAPGTKLTTNGSSKENNSSFNLKANIYPTNTQSDTIDTNSSITTNDPNNNNNNNSINTTNNSITKPVIRSKSKTRSIFFWCGALCFSCDEDCRRVWKICICRHNDRDDWNGRHERQTSLLSQDSMGEIGENNYYDSRYGGGGGSAGGHYGVHNYGNSMTPSIMTSKSEYNKGNYKNDLYDNQLPSHGSLKHTKTLELSVGVGDINEKNKSSGRNGSALSSKSNPKSTDKNKNKNKSKHANRKNNASQGQGFRYNEEIVRSPKNAKLTKSRTEHKIPNLPLAKDEHDDVNNLGAPKTALRATSEPHKNFRD